MMLFKTVVKGRINTQAIALRCGVPVSTGDAVIAQRAQRTRQACMFGMPGTQMPVKQSLSDIWMSLLFIRQVPHARMTDTSVTWATTALWSPSTSEQKGRPHVLVSMIIQAADCLNIFARFIRPIDT